MSLSWGCWEYLKPKVRILSQEPGHRSEDLRRSEVLDLRSLEEVAILRYPHYRVLSGSAGLGDASLIL